MGIVLMILLDSRIGSRHYADILGSKATLTQLDSADACFSGVSGTTIGIEIKKILDAVNCMFDGRLTDRQIPLMREQYDISYLIIEGIWRGDPKSGVLQWWKEWDSTKETKCGKWLDATSGMKRLMYSSFEQWLTSLEIQGNVLLRSSASALTTATLLTSLYTWYQRESHSSFRIMHQSQGENATLSRPTRLRRMLAHLPHVGWDRSAVYSQRFRSMRQAVDAALDDWYIEGQIAEKSAVDIVRALNEP